jgi:glucose/arabinose dehydrogenase
MRFQYTLAPGWKVAKIAGGLTQPRTVLFDTLGNALVLQASSGISVHTFGPDGCFNSSTSIFQNRALNHGLSLTPDGKTLYASSETTVWQWSYDAATRKISNQKVVVKGISTGIHTTRTVVVSPKNPNILIVSVGSNANFDYPTGSPSAGRACVKTFDVSKAPEGGYSYNTEGSQYGYGLRNEIGVVFDPNGMGWGVENSGDVSKPITFLALNMNGADTIAHRISNEQSMASQLIFILIIPPKNLTIVSYLDYGMQCT